MHPRVVRGVRAAAVVPLLLVASVSAGGQWLHDARRSAASDAAAQLAREIAGPARTARQLETLEQASMASAERVFAGARLQMDRSLLSLRRWSSLEAFLTDTEAALGDASAVSQAAWSVQRESLEAAAAAASREKESLLAGLRNCGNSTNSVSLSQRLGQWQGIGDEVSSLFGLPNPLRAHQGAAAELAATYSALETLYKGARPAVSCGESQRRVEALQAAEAHIERLGLIAARREMEVTELQALCRTAKTQLAAIPAGYREMDVLAGLQLATRELREFRTMFLSDPTEGETRRRYLAQQSTVRIMLSLLLNASALAARSETPSRVALLRMAEEMRRESVRRSGATSAVYAQLLTDGAGRLSTHYQGGLRWETLSRLLMGSLPATLIR